MVPCNLRIHAKISHLIVMQAYRLGATKMKLFLLESRDVLQEDK